MSRKRVLASAAAAVLLVGALTACSDSGSGEDGPVTIKLLEYQEARADVVKALIPEFERAMAKRGKEVKVELVADTLTDDQFRTKITQQLHSGTAPDVIDMGGSNVTGLAGAGYLLKLDKYLDKWDGWDQYYGSVKDGARQPDGGYYSLPHEASLQSLFYRKDVLERLGVDTSQPRTWDELIGRMKQVKAKTGEAPMVLPAGTAWGAGSWTEGLLPLVANTGSPLFDRESRKWTLKSKGLSATFDLYEDLVKEDLLPVRDLQNPNPWEPTKYKKFPDGKIVVAAQGSWGWKYDWGPEGAAPIKNVREKVGTWDYPALVPGTEPHSISGGGYVFSVNAKSEHPDAAAELVKWLSSGKPLAKQLTAVGALAPRKDLSGTAPYKDEPTLREAERKLTTSVQPTLGDGEDQVSQAVQGATAKIVTGDADGSQAAADFAEEAEELLGRPRVAR
ncbi:extracellular solute-binding protein [Streptomyces sp. NBC_01186]|uniref:ABC transporter substrate-binding protein n=1 Tax=unclassified Streptomyces TaxID=2593676 RepID=UPI002DD9F1B5|nr:MULTISPECIES: extracellular solute-binding protein [unclassified Streptomyces]WSB74958.1 extracellular solute-binding protein [Streptomyces sp. NBC_01775]WSS16761.1 extracellular solute-binding protein [Streptomyces sp. NBC_01186]